MKQAKEPTMDFGERKLPRGHAYIRMRNRGTSIHLDYVELDNAQADRMMKAVLDILKADGKSGAGSKGRT